MKNQFLTAALVASVTAGLAVTTVVRSAPPVFAQQPACLHGTDEAADQKARRQGALQVARAVNTAQAAYSSRTREYGRLENLSVTAPVPYGFTVGLSATSDSYAFSVKDAVDPCHFAYFSDQNGVIFHGEAIR